MNLLLKIYHKLLNEYSPQGWWPKINKKTLLCEYHKGDYAFPRTDAELFEVCVGALLTQNTSWYPGVVRALQQLKLGRPFTKEELEVIRKAEILQEKISENRKNSPKEIILTQNTAWINVEKTLINLFNMDVIDPEMFLKSDPEKIKEAIKPAGYFNQKLKKLIEFSNFFLSLNGKTPTRPELLNVWGIGPETADSILLYAYKVPSFVVDAYTKRIFVNLGMISVKDDYNSIKTYFEKNLTSDYKLFQEYHALIVEHAKRYYQKKDNFKNCPLYLEFIK